MKTTFVNIGDVVVSKIPACFETILGSCVSVCLWDKELKIGGLNHIMLPEQTGLDDMLPTAYAQTSINLLVKKILDLGSQPGNLTAKVFGGGIAVNVLGQAFNVGRKNVSAVKEILREYNIPVIMEYTEPSNGIRLKFYTGTGRAFVKDFFPLRETIINGADVNQDNAACR